MLNRFFILPHRFTSRKQRDVQLRHMPYPFKGALAICNDIDDSSPELFTLSHQILSTTLETPQGKGLGLEIGDSMFVWTYNPQAVSLLNADNTPTRWSKALTALCQSGWIDCLHGLGDFNRTEGFDREQAKIAYRFLTERGIRIPIWTNHGNTQNVQNFYARHRPSCIGDLPGHPAYHHDLAAAYGISAYWWHELKNYPLSCAKPDFQHHQQLLWENRLKNLAKLLLGQWNRRIDSRILTRLALPVQLRSGRKIWAFTRYNADAGGHIWKRNPGRHTLAHQLSESFLEQLKRQQGYAIVYTHFAKPRWEKGRPIFETENMQALKRLKEYQRRGDILVATTHRLLSYWVRSHFLEWESTTIEGNPAIRITGINDPVHGWYLPREDELMGLSFYCQKPDKTRVYLGNTRLDSFLRFDEDFSGKPGIHFPWRALKPPANNFQLQP